MRGWLTRKQEERGWLCDPLVLAAVLAVRLTVCCRLRKTLTRLWLVNGCLWQAFVAVPAPPHECSNLCIAFTFPALRFGLSSHCFVLYNCTGTSANNSIHRSGQSIFSLIFSNSHSWLWQRNTAFCLWEYYCQWWSDRWPLLLLAVIQSDNRLLPSSILFIDSTVRHDREIKTFTFFLCILSADAIFMCLTKIGLTNAVKFNRLHTFVVVLSPKCLMSHSHHVWLKYCLPCVSTRAALLCL